MTHPNLRFQARDHYERHVAKLRGALPTDATPAVRIYEVSPRDGLQNESVVVPAEDKVALVRRLVDAGVRDIEVTSFVNNVSIVCADGVYKSRFTSGKRKEDMFFLSLCFCVQVVKEGKREREREVSRGDPRKTLRATNNINGSIDRASERERATFHATFAR